MQLRVSCFLACFCLSLAASAQSQYRFSVWTAEEGLPQNVVRGISQTPDGYLWIATFDGVARFDGIRFTVFNRSNTQGIDKNRFFAMESSPNGDLWLPTEGGGLTRFRNGIFKTYDVDVRAITGDEAGNIWILQPSGIFEWNEFTSSFVDVTPLNLKLPFRNMRWENEGFWAVDSDGLHCFLRGRFVTYPLPRWLKGNTIGVVAVEQRGGVWIETSDGSHVHIDAEGKPGPLLKPTAPALDSFVDGDGHAWKISIGYHLDRTIEFLRTGGTQEIAFSTLYQDREANLWLANGGQGLYRLQRQSIQSLSVEQGLVDRNVYPVFQDRAGSVWIGAWTTGISRMQGGKLQNYTVADGLPSGLPTAITEDREGRLWVASHGGLRVLEGKRFGETPVVLASNPVVQAIYQDREGTLWFGTVAGLFAYRNGQTRAFTIQNGLATNDVRTMIEDPAGGFWIGGYGGLTHFHEGHFIHWTEKDGLPSNTVRSLYEDAQGVLWIGTYDGGLGHFKDGKFTRYTERDGLFNNGVFQILEDAQGRFWISCNRGIYRVDKNELNQFAAGLRKTINSVAYGKPDGMLNVECNGGIWPAGTRTRDGKLWFPTQDGVAIIDPNNIRQNALPPPVVIESLTADHVAVPPSMLPPRIPTKAANLEIAYTALSFINSGQIRFKYKLDGLDSQWVDAGSRRTAYYSHVPPGKYVFRVIAGNSDNVWNMEGKSLSFTVLTPMYRTWWFITLVLLASAGLLQMAWHRRVAQLKHLHTIQHTFSQQLIASQENERKRIAAELHDSIGQRLVVINNLALFFLRSGNSVLSSEEGVKSIEEISAEATSAIEEAREISYNLRPFQLDRLGLTKAVDGLIRRISAASSIVISSHIENIDNQFPEELRINFYRILQESLNNVMKHANATEVSVRVQRSEGRVVLSIQDNGHGFALDSNPHPFELSGFGMTGMAERARLLNGEFDVRSAPGRGTTVIITIPAEENQHG